jgi:hypothetical protein
MQWRNGAFHHLVLPNRPLGTSCGYIYRCHLKSCRNQESLSHRPVTKIAGFSETRQGCLPCEDLPFLSGVMKRQGTVSGGGNDGEKAYRMLTQNAREMNCRLMPARCGIEEVVIVER